jgi:hypothetical protein
LNVFDCDYRPLRDLLLKKRAGLKVFHFAIVEDREVTSQLHGRQT